MKNLFFILFSSVLMLLASCEPDKELNDSIYVADKEYPDLPAYTEWGYNTFGSYIDREIFEYSDAVPAKVITSQGKTTFMLKGKKGYSTDMSLTFNLSGFTAQTYSDLAQLNDTTFDLADTSNHVTLRLYNNNADMQVFNGQLQFKRAQLLYIDDVPSRVILSGYFHLQGLIESEPVSIYYGRFDVSIAEGINFYKY
jgi:hypothetical protein